MGTISSWWREALIGGVILLLLGDAVGTGWPALSVLLSLGGLATLGVGAFMALERIEWR